MKAVSERANLFAESSDVVLSEVHAKLFPSAVHEAALLVDLAELLVEVIQHSYTVDQRSCYIAPMCANKACRLCCDVSECLSHCMQHEVEAFNIL